MSSPKSRELHMHELESNAVAMSRWTLRRVDSVEWFYGMQIGNNLADCLLIDDAESVNSFSRNSDTKVKGQKLGDFS